MNVRRKPKHPSSPSTTASTRFLRQPKTFSFAAVVVFALIALGYGIHVNFFSHADAVCTQTVSPSDFDYSGEEYQGGGLSKIISSSASGAVICLSSGSYDTTVYSGSTDSNKNSDVSVNLYNLTSAPSVTLEPAPGATVALGEMNLNGVSNLTITGFTGSSSSDGLAIIQAGFGNSHNITFTNNAMTTNGVSISDDGSNANIMIAHNSFVGFVSSGENSRLSVTGSTSNCSDGVTIEDNLISGGESDGVDIGGNECGTKILNNEITNIDENNCNGIHCDGVQTVGGIDTLISGNYFSNDSDCWLVDDNSTGLTITNNICVPSPTESLYAFQLGGAQGTTIEHNTFLLSGENDNDGWGSYANSHTGSDGAQPSTVIWENNISAIMIQFNAESCPSGNCSGNSLTEDYNLVGNGGGGAHDITGSPTFTGGSSPSTIAGFLLSTSSEGHNAASDGTDMGADASTVGIQGSGSSSGDTTPPTVSVSAPANGATVSGTTTVTANASDNVGVSSVQFKLDGVNLGAADTASPYSYSWDTTGASNGTHTLTAVATDTSNNSTTSSSVTVTVSNSTADTTPPTTSISSGPASSTTSTSATFAFTGSDNVTPAGSLTFQCQLDSGSYNACTSPKTYTGLSVGSHIFSVKATDAAGNTDPSPATQSWTITSSTPIVGDINGDGAVNIFDLSIMLANYGTSYAPADLNDDGVVNIFDLSILLSHYGE